MFTSTNQSMENGDEIPISAFIQMALECTTELLGSILLAERSYTSKLSTPRKLVELPLIPRTPALSNLEMFTYPYLLLGLPIAISAAVGVIRADCQLIVRVRLDIGVRINF